MILTDNHQYIIHGDKRYEIGMRFIARNCSYSGMEGVIKEIRSGFDVETTSSRLDIYCCLYANGVIDICSEKIPFEVKYDGIILRPEMIGLL